LAEKNLPCLCAYRERRRRTIPFKIALFHLFFFFFGRKENEFEDNSKIDYFTITIYPKILGNSYWDILILV
jgi:hypothetical protein